jgi:drug/metabolite transporter (DMT)-like permease
MTTLAMRERQSALGGILWMVGAALAFSVNFAVVRHLQDHISTFEVVFFRQVFGTILMLPWLAHAGLGALKTTWFPLHCQRMLWSYAAMFLGYYSLLFIPLSDSVTLQFTLPVWTAVLAAMILGEKVGIHRWLAIAAGFAGVLVIVRPGFVDLNVGIAMVLVATAFYAVTDVIARALARTDRTILIVFYSFVLPLPFAAIPAAFTWTTPGPDLWLPLLIFALSSTVAQWCLTKSLATADASLVSPILFLRLPFVAAIAWYFFAQPTDFFTWLGAAIIFAATYLLARREAQTARRGSGT